MTFQTQAREWLHAQLPKTDHLESIGVAKRIVDRIESTLSSDLEKPLPLTIGLFGGWGSGKTTVLAHLANELDIKHWPYLYINAWRQSEFSEVLPSILYNLGIHEAESHGTKFSSENLLVACGALGHRGKAAAEKASEKIFGFSIVELFGAGVDVLNSVDAARNKHIEMAKKYLSGHDEVDQYLKVVFDSRSKVTPPEPLVVLVDELDRCDPEEAYSVLKSLRILLLSTGIPVVFVLAANPDAIAEYVRHRFGIQADSSAYYESALILEKFVDFTFDVVGDRHCGRLLRERWRGIHDDGSILTFLHRIELNSCATGTLWASLQRSNPYYANIRVLLKQMSKFPLRDFPWTRWHLAIAGPEMRERIRRTASDIVNAASVACGEFLQQHLQNNPKGGFEDGTAYTGYLAKFKTLLGNRFTSMSNDSSGKALVGPIQALYTSPFDSIFVANLALIPAFSIPDDAQLRLALANPMTAQSLLKPEWDSLRSLLSS